MTTTLYPARFGGPRRDSVVSASSRIEGRIGWARELGFPAESPPRDLLVWESRVVAVATDRVAVWTSGGERSWEREKRTRTPAAAVGVRLYVASRENRLEAVDGGNAPVLADAPFPGLASREFEVLLLWPRERDFVATTYVSDPTYSEEEVGGSVPEPLLAARRTVYGKPISSWGQDLRGAMTLPPLFLPERDRWIVATDDVVVADVGSKDPPARFRLALDEPGAWSADAEGTLCITGRSGGRKALVAVSLEGAERWRWVDSEHTDGWAPSQPPIGSAGGRVCVLTEGRVLAFDAGKPAWQHDARTGKTRQGTASEDDTGEIGGTPLPSDAKLRHGTMTADGSLLVVGGATLFQLDRDGRRGFSVDVGAEILTPPVVDAEGSVYVATATKLVKFR